MKPVDEKYYMTDADSPPSASSRTSAPPIRARNRRRVGAFSIVGSRARGWPSGIPFLIGLWIALQKAAVLF